MKKHIFRISVVVLIIILGIVSFYMLFVHVPYYQHYHQLANVRNEICEKNYYEYMDYFYEYYGKETYYILKVKKNNVLTYVVHDKNGDLVESYQGDVAQEDVVRKAILEKYNVEIDNLEIAYENQKLVYYGKYQTKETLMYVFYDLVSGEFVKAVKLED